MSDAVSAEAVLRLGSFAGVLAAVVLWEVLRPRRPVTITRQKRWPHNLALMLTSTLCARLLAPLPPVALAVLLAADGGGWLALHTLPPWLGWTLTLLALDIAIYWQHRLFHAVPVLWRLHRVHHADLHLDVTSGVRFHPIEIVLSLFIKLAIVWVLGAPPEAVLLFEVILNAASMFNHANARLSDVWDARLRWFIVTPDMHRIHHSIHRDETDSNFGFSVSWWDYLFRSYRSSPRDGQLGMQIGIPQFRDVSELGVLRMLWQPFRRD